MRIKRSLIWMILLSAILTVFTVNFVVAAEDAPFSLAVEVSASTALAKEPLAVRPGDVVTVSVKVEETPGVAATRVALKYDTQLFEPVLNKDGELDYTVGEVFDEKQTVKALDGKIVYASNFVYGTTKNSGKTGVLMTVSFRAKNTADADGAFTLVHENVGDSVRLTDAGRLNTSFTIVTGSHAVSVHNFGEGVRKDATCLADGGTSYTCTTCGYELVTDTVSATGHDWDAPSYVWADDHTACTATRVCKNDASHVETEAATVVSEITAAPTCESDGVKTFTATFENEIFETQTATEAISGGHNYGELIAKVEPTCEKPGKNAYYKCADCGKLFNESKEETTEEALAIAAKGHNYGDLIAKVDATCEGAGKNAYYKCADCGKLFDENKAETTEEALVIAAKGHDEEVIAGKDATCTEPGLTEGKKCKVCGTVTVAQTEVPAKGHDEEVIAGKDATCTEPGLTEGKKCKVCGVILAEQTEIAATGHTFGEWTETKKATTKAAGEESRTCSICNTVETREIPKLESNAATVIIIVCIVVVVLAGAGVGVFLFIRKKRAA